MLQSVIVQAQMQLWVLASVCRAFRASSKLGSSQWRASCRATSHVLHISCRALLHQLSCSCRYLLCRTGCRASSKLGSSVWRASIVAMYYVLCRADTHALDVCCSWPTNTNARDVCRDVINDLGVLLKRAHPRGTGPPINTAKVSVEPSSGVATSLVILAEPCSPSRALLDHLLARMFIVKPFDNIVGTNNMCSVGTEASLYGQTEWIDKLSIRLVGDCSRT